MHKYVHWAFALLAFGLSIPLPAQAVKPGSITAVGSTSMEPLLLFWKDYFKPLYPGFALDVLPEGTNAAPKALAEGRAQMALMSREMKPEEVAVIQAKLGFAPTIDQISSGAYPLSRFLFIYVAKAPGKPLGQPLQSFLEYILSRDGQALVKSTGQVAMPEDLLRLNRRRIY